MRQNNNNNNKLLEIARTIDANPYCVRGLRDSKRLIPSTQFQVPKALNGQVTGSMHPDPEGHILQQSYFEQHRFCDSSKTNFATGDRFERSNLCKIQLNAFLELTKDIHKMISAHILILSCRRRYDFVKVAVKGSSIRMQLITLTYWRAHVVSTGLRTRS